MFSYLLGFNELCSQVTPMKLVDCINTVFTTFDAIVDKHDVFKVSAETCLCTTLHCTALINPAI